MGRAIELLGCCVPPCAKPDEPHQESGPASSDALILSPVPVARRPIVFAKLCLHSYEVREDGIHQVYSSITKDGS